jgi:hypothetical protein
VVVVGRRPGLAGHELVDLNGAGRTQSVQKQQWGWQSCRAASAGPEKVDVVHGAVVHAQTAAGVPAEFRMELEGVGFFDGVFDGGPQFGGVIGVLGGFERCRRDQVGLSVLDPYASLDHRFPEGLRFGEVDLIRVPGGGVRIGVPGRKTSAYLVPPDDRKPRSFIFLTML